MDTNAAVSPGRPAGWIHLHGPLPEGWLILNNRTRIRSRNSNTSKFPTHEHHPIFMAIPTRHSVWAYTPSIVASVVFILLFLELTVAHCWRIWRTKTMFCIVFAMGGIFEIVGYATRAAAYSKHDRLALYVVQSVFILVAPALFAASTYMTLGRVIQSLHAEHHSLVRVIWLTKLFVSGDILSFVVQAGAAPLMVLADQRYLKIGQGIVISGLLIQIVMFGIFMVTAVLFEVRVVRHPTVTSHTHGSWRQTMRMLYAVSALIMVRSIFRVVEYIMGFNGYLLQHEWSLYVFDATLMSGVMAIFFWRYPSNLSSPSRIISPSDDEIQLTHEAHTVERKR